MANCGRGLGIAVGIGLGLLLGPASPTHALVTTSQIADKAVTTPKIANSAVNAAKLGNNAVTNAKILNGAVTASKLANNAVTAAKVGFYGKVVIVAPEGGDFTSPVAAMESITDAGDTNPYLVKIMPGVYDIGGATVQMKPYVDIEGSGPHTTKITGTVSEYECNPSVPTDCRPKYGVVTGASQAELRFLSVGNTGAASAVTATTAILARQCDGMTISHVWARAVGTRLNVAILVHRTAVGGDPVWIADCDAYAEGGDTAAVGIGIIASTGAEDELGAVVLNSAATAMAAANGLNVGIKFTNATGAILGSVANGENYAFVSDGGGGVVEGALLTNSVVVKNNNARSYPMVIANSAAADTPALTVSAGALVVTNSSLSESITLQNSASLTLLNSSVGLVTVDGATFKAANSSLGGQATVTADGFSSATCAAATRTDTFATLDESCQ
jgi:hypothetical protein